MNYPDIFSNFLTSTFIIGLVIYFINKHIDKRFSKIEEFQKTLITIRKERYDTLLKTLQEIWEKLVETEYYIRHDIVEQYKIVQNAKQEYLAFDSTPLKNAFVFIEKRSILLDESLSEHTRNLFINHLQNTYNGFVKILNEVHTGQITLEEVNAFIPNSLGNDYKKDIEKLRKEFERQAREILYDDK